MNFGRNNRAWRLAVAGCLFACRVLADDHGDAAVAATALVPDGGAVAGVINDDVDKDWFSFSTLPWVGYSITVATGTLWDSEADLYASDGATCQRATNSAGWATPLTVAWSNSGARTKRHLEIGGFAEFTTGTYSVAVARLNWVDADGDGMFDPWEVEMLGSTNQPAGGDPDNDGFPNIDEYYLQTDPDDADSGLFVVRLTPAATGTVVRWDAAQNGTYRLWSSTNLSSAAPGWTFFGEKTKFDASPAWDELVDPAATNARRQFYRVEFTY
ncbi:MAG TPA: hypothetical protein P5567_13085 [Kiritimatiellia bacterium]|nr:hypothetical protein [Kiritimatiellia bacterium]HRZ13377.1 hypothetical protein [Kiritimatiellia bacterium]HSA18983.1 hypothetical protein [Kiritimatiellia bacterium]